ncbi:alanine/glycine:cation symporter family protein [Nocardiopsis sp. RSe5-2]|uniref:Alanine/glycine:cation symporter family protein n=1 Tax=Nocardiopsis endophytica TaxID=3018445 RepID=A0ABT4U8B4_9ACTN|nr:alanine/glycine:cation symporter family protein [Nocardiopsis endophytica]MDA2813198.1 alanine/glycine:cation symporter family protein [Nocardiopsis endophytica]
MDALDSEVTALSDAFWAYLLIPVLLVLSIYFTVRSGGVQFRMLPEMFRAMRAAPGRAPDGGRPISALQAFAVSAAARIGTGNIAGVATAIALGGPGAVFWMWSMALVVGAASFVESTLAQLYKVRDTTGYRGGPAYYMQAGLNARWMGVLFAVVITVTFGLVFSSIQSNTIAGALVNTARTAGLPETSWLPYAVGALVAALTAVVVFGGARRIARAATLLVPVMATVYIAMGLVIIAMNAAQVPAMVGEIVAHAFGLREIAAGGVGTAIVQGMRRGMFSNEAGLGSAPNAGASAAVSHPVKQGLVQTLGVYFDTLLVCSTTAFIILLSEPTYTEEAGPTLTQNAMEANLGPWALHVLTAVILLVAFTSVLGNTFYGSSNVAFISPSPHAATGFRLAVVAAVFLGAIGSGGLVWTLGDLTMGVMALVNLAALAPLAGTACRLLSDYVQQRREGRDPVFTRDRMPGLTGVDCWEESDVAAFRDRARVD